MHKRAETLLEGKGVDLKMDLIKEHFLPSDEREATAEMMCAAYCLDQARYAVLREDYKKALAYFENATRSIRELARLNEKKKSQEKLEKLISELSKSRGLETYRKELGL